MATDNKYDRQLRLWGATGQVSSSSFRRTLSIPSLQTGSEPKKTIPEAKDTIDQLNVSRFFVTVHRIFSLFCLLILILSLFFITLPVSFRSRKL